MDFSGPTAIWDVAKPLCLHNTYAHIKYSPYPIEITFVL